MLHIEQEQLRSMSVENIVELQNKFSAELTRRRQQEKERLLSNLWNALNAIYDAHYCLYYYNEKHPDRVCIYGSGEFELSEW